MQKENRVEVQVEQEAIITNQVIHFNHVNINDKKVPCDGNAIFTFEEEFRIKGLNTPDGRLNVKVNFIYKIPGKAHIYNQIYYSSLNYRKIYSLRKVFEKVWWQKPENIKWVFSFVLSLSAILISLLSK